MGFSTNEGYKLIIATSVSLFISLTSLLLRLLCRRLKNIPLLTDDYLVISSVIFITAIGVVSSLMVGTGFGSPADNFNSDEVKLHQQLSFTIFLLYPPTVTFAKLSILFFYRRILPVKQILVSTTIVSSILVFWCIAIFCTAVFRCTPLYGTLRPDASSVCISEGTYGLLSQTTSAAIDIVIILLPLKSLWESALKTSQKIVATVLFAAGILTLSGDIIKLAIALHGENSVHESGYQINIIVWMNVTPALAILAASIPVLRPLIHSTRQFGSKRNSDSVAISPTDEERACAKPPFRQSSAHSPSPSETALLKPIPKAHTRKECVESAFGDKMENQDDKAHNDQFFMDL